MKLKFLQHGGSFNPRYSVYEPYIIPEQEISEATGGKGSKGKSIDSDILKMIRESFSNGLPSDLQAASNTIANVFSNIEQMLNQPDIYGTGSIASAYARALPLLKSIEFNSKEYDNVYQSLNENGSMQEVAINSIGQIAVQSEEGFEWITPEQYHANSELYTPLTNALLLDSRANSPELAFQNSVFETLKNGVSVDTITKQILEYASKVGSSEQIQTGYGYVPGGNIMKDFKTFSQKIRLEGFDPKQDDLYSYKVTTKSERENAYLMLDLIYNMLPTPAKALLKYKSNGTDNGAKGMIAILMGTTTDHSVATEITLEDGYSKGTDGDSSGSNKYFNHVFRAAMGLGRDENFVIIPGTTNALSVLGTSIPIMDSSSEMLQKDLLSDVKGSTVGQMLLTADISIAGQHIDSSSANKIFLKERRMILVDLPYTYEEGTNNIIPDYKLLEQKDLVEQYVKDNHLSFQNDFDKIKQFIEENKLTIRFNRDGKVQFTNVKQFALFNASFPQDVFEKGKIKNGKYIKPLNKEDSLTTYQQIMQQNGWTKKDWDYDVEGLFGDGMYQGTVAVPVDTAFLNLVNKDLDEETVLELGEIDKRRRARDNFNYDNRQLGQ